MRTVFFSFDRRQSCIYRLGRVAFSLVEVVLALSIATFGILVIIALLPVGMQSVKDSLEETTAVNVLSEVIADRQATPFSTISTLYHLPAMTNGMLQTSNFFGLTDDNAYTSQMTRARYRIDYTVTPPANGSFNPYQANLKVSWPAASTNAVEYIEVVVTFPQS